MLVFTYGMLTHPSNMVGFHGRRAYIKHATFEFDYFANVNIDSTSNSTVWGVVWEVNENKLDIMDMTEGVPDLYKRVTTTAYFSDGTEESVFIYTMTPETRLRFRDEQPTMDYIKTVEDGYKYFNIPTIQLLCPHHPSRTQKY